MSDPLRGERIAKWLARAGVTSRRDAERLLLEGHVVLNNTRVSHPATFVSPGDIVVVNGMVVDSLGSLWMPKFFYEGFAIHGDTEVPPVPVSHGCARVSNEAIEWIWADNIDPIGTTVWVY